MTDQLGDFLTAYDEYLDGKRDYADLPPCIYPGDRMTDPYRTAPPLPRTPTDVRLVALERNADTDRAVVRTWASRTTWHFAVIILLAGAVLALFAYVSDQHDQIRQLQRAQDELRCEMGWRAPVGGDSGLP